MLEIDDISVNDRLLNVSLKIEPGHLFGIVGPNGAGKTTLLKLIAGLICPTNGSISCYGNTIGLVDRHSLSRMIHLVQQGTSTPFDYTARDIISMGCYHNKNNMDDVMKLVEVYHLASKPITQLSMGERQRVYIARALATECPVLLFDEPTANLDIRHQLEIWELLQRLTEQNKIVIIASHDLQFTKKYCKQVALIDEGRCTKWGKTENILTNFDINQTFKMKVPCSITYCN